LKKKLISLIMVSILTMSLVACGDGATIGTTDKSGGVATTPEVVLKLGEIHTAGYPTALADEEFSRLVSEKTNGRIKIEVFTDATLGEEADVIEQMQMGTLGFARVSLAPMANFVPEMNALMMPYLYNDSTHMWKVLNSELGQSMLTSIKSAGLVGLCWYDGGTRCFYTDVKITKLSDMKGLTFRMQNNEMMFALCSALGATAINLGQGDCYQAIQNGTIDGAENNIPTYESFSHDEVAPYYVEDNHSMIPEILAGSEIALAQLTAEDQAIIKTCAKETQAFEIKAWAEREITAKAAIQAANPKIQWVKLDPGELEKFQAAVQPLYTKYGAKYIETINKIKAMGK